MLRSKFYNSETRDYEEQTRYVGRSLFARRQTVKVMSDIWEEHLVLHSVAEDGHIVENSVAGGYDFAGKELPYEIDATDEAFEDYRAYREEFHFNTLKNEAENEVVKPSVKGRVVKVVKGRRAKGTVGKVVVVMERPYSMGWQSVMKLKLGIATSPRKVKVVRNGREYENYADMEWVWAQNCEVEKPEAVDYDAIRKDAQERAKIDVDRLRENCERYKVAS
jgi:hypothetical protein